MRLPFDAVSLLVEQINRNKLKPGYRIHSSDRGMWHVSNDKDGCIRLTNMKTKQIVKFECDKVEFEVADGVVG